MPTRRMSVEAAIYHTRQLQTMEEFAKVCASSPHGPVLAPEVFWPLREQFPPDLLRKVSAADDSAGHGHHFRRIRLPGFRNGMGSLNNCRTIISKIYIVFSKNLN